VAAEEDDVSEFTRCNYCSRRDMEARAEMRGVELIVKLEVDGEMQGWWSARYSDRDEPSAWWMALSDRCVC
jgi:hypothetical protein